MLKNVLTLKHVRTRPIDDSDASTPKSTGTIGTIETTPQGKKTKGKVDQVKK